MSQHTGDRLLLIEKVLLLKSLPIFRDTPENILADLAPLMQEEEFEQGTTIFREGEIGDCMFIIKLSQIKSELVVRLTTNFCPNFVGKPKAFAPSKTAYSPVSSSLPCP